MRKTQRQLRDRVEMLEGRLAMLEERFPVAGEEPDLFEAPTPPPQPPSFRLSCMIDAEVVTVEVLHSDTLEDVRARIAYGAGRSPDELVVYWDNDPLHESALGLSLSALGIDSSEVLQFRRSA
jgi:hypothetical protein